MKSIISELSYTLALVACKLMGDNIDTLRMMHQEYCNNCGCSYPACEECFRVWLCKGGYNKMKEDEE